MSESPTPFQPCPWIHQGRDRFTGRRRELADLLAALGALASGEREGADGHRLLTLTGAAGVGKTALAAAAVDQARRRELFPGGILEISCEHVREPELLLADVLEALAVAPQERLGDGVQRIREAWDRHPGARLLVLDHLDGLAGGGDTYRIGEYSPQRQRDAEAAKKKIAALLSEMLAAPGLAILATCREALDVPDLEKEVALASLSLDESLDLLFAYLEAPAEDAARLRRDFAAEDDPLRQVLSIIDRRPLAVRLMARRLQRCALEPTALRREVFRHFLKILPLVAGKPEGSGSELDSAALDAQLERGALAEFDRLLSRTKSFAFIKEHFTFDYARTRLEPEVHQLFILLWLLPGGVWCGRRPERWLEWEQFFLTDDWKASLRDLLDAALVELEADPSGESEGFYRLLPAVAEFSRDLYESRPKTQEGADWGPVAVGFWGESLQRWERFAGGAAAGGGRLTPAAAAGGLLQDELLAVFRGNQTNLIATTDYCCAEAPQLAAWFLRTSFEFLSAGQQWTLARSLAQRVVAALRRSQTEAAEIAPCLVCQGVAERSLGEAAAAARSLAEAVELFESSEGDDPESEPPRALAYFHLGAVNRALDEPEEALAAYRKAEEVWQRLAATHPELADEPEGFAGQGAAFRSQRAEALVEIGALHHDLGRHEAARDAFTEALATVRELAAEDPAFAPRVAKPLNNLAIVHGALGDHDKALEAQREALAVYRRMVGAPWGDGGEIGSQGTAEPQLATALGNLGSLERRLGDPRAAREHFREAFAIHERLAAERPLAFEPALALSLNNLAIVHRDLHDPEKARRYFHQALAIQRRLAAADPARYEAELALTLNNLGSVEQDLDDSEAAIRALEEALAIRRRLAESRPEAFAPELAATLSNLGAVRRETGDGEAARALVTEALALYRRLARDRPAAHEGDVAMALDNLATVESSLGAHDEALPLFKEALAIYRRLAVQRPAAFDPQIGMTLTNLGQLMKDSGELETARSCFATAVKVYMKLVEQDVDAHLPKLAVPLRKYLALTPETDGDEVWQLWRGLEKMMAAIDELPGPESEPSADDDGS